jgi:hypothetical protein
LCDTTFLASTAKSVEKVTPERGVGLNPRVWASFFRASTSRPARLSLRGILADDVEDRVGVRVLDGVPAVGGGPGLVDHDEAHGAPARGFLVLVGPAAVVGHGLAAEVAFSRLVVGVVDQDERDLAVQVDALEVVPVAFRRSDPVADEDDRRVLDGDVVDAGLGGADRHLLALLPAQRLAAGLHADRDGALDVELGQRHVLGPGPLARLQLVAAGLQARGLELVGDVGDRLGLAGRGRPAALEGVGRQDLDVFGELGRIDVRVGGEGGGHEDAESGAAQQKLFHRSLRTGVSKLARP